MIALSYAQRRQVRAGPETAEPYVHSPAAKGEAASAITNRLLKLAEGTADVALPQPLDRQLSKLQFERDIARLHRLGPQAFGKLLREIGKRHLCHTII